MNEPDDRPAEESPEALRRMMEALHPTDEENARAERFATHLLETPRTPASGPSTPATTEPDREDVIAAAAEPDRRSWRRDILMVAIGAGFGVIGTLVVSAVR